jgi:hypothetical protein
MADNTVRIMSKLPGSLRIVEEGRTVIINGVNSILRDQGSLIVPNPHGEGLAATTIMSSEDWALVLKYHKGHEAIKNGVIWESKSPEAAKREIKEREKVKTGFEPHDPKAPVKGPDGKVSVETLVNED